MTIDYRDYSNSYNGEKQGIKTSEVVIGSETLNEDKLSLKGILEVGTHTTVGGASAEDITITGLLATDDAIVSLWDAGTNAVTIASIATTADTLTVTFSGDPGNDAIVQYAIVR